MDTQQVEYLLKTAFELLACSDPSGVADRPLWYETKVKWLAVYAKFKKEQSDSL